MQLQKIKILFLVIFLFSVVQLSNAQDNRREQLLSLVNEELEEIIRLNKQVSIKNPNLLLRLAELYLEKARIIKEIESQKFLALPTEERSKINRKEFFRNSSNYYVKAQKASKLLLKKFPNYPEKSAVLYILAYNAKEFQQPERAKKYFEHALKYSKSNSELNKKTKLALAEQHYNEKNYSSAIKYYEDALAEEKGKWWTKDAYNLAWCYFRSGRKSQAISTMQKILNYSSKGEFFDMSREAKRDLAMFYVESGKVDDAITFFKRSGEESTKSLISAARHLIDQSKYAIALDTLKEAEKTASDPSQIAEINTLILEITEKYSSPSSHYQAFKKMVNLKPNYQFQKDQYEIIKYQGERQAALLQRSTYDEKVGKRKKDKGTLTIKYFEGLSTFNPADSDKYHLNAAETAASIDEIEQSASFYEKSILSSREKGNDKNLQLAQKGLMALMAKGNIPKSISDKYLILAYKAQINQNPRSEDTKMVYQRLFLEYLNRKMPAEAESVIDSFKKSYPSDRTLQEAMVANLIDYHRKNKDYSNFERVFNRIKKKELFVSDEVRNRLKMDLTAVDFEKAERAHSSGDKIKALKYYFSIYKNPEKRQESRKISAYNIAVLYTELGRPEYIYKWGKSSIEMMESEDIKKFETSLFKMTETLFDLGYPNYSSELGSLLFAKLCNLTTSQKDPLFKNLIVLKLSSDDLEKTQDLINFGRRCSISKEILNFAKYELIDELINEEKYNSVRVHFEQVFGEGTVEPKFALLLEKYADKLRENEDIDQARKFMQMIPNLLGGKNTKNLPVEVLDVYVRFEMVNLERLSSQILRRDLAFPEERFNNLVKEKFKALEQLNKKADEIIKMGSARGIVKTFKILSETYSGLGQMLFDFNPSGKDEAYVKSFKENMAKLDGQLKSKASSINQDAEKNIMTNKILSNFNYDFTTKQVAPIKFSYTSIRRPMLMDRSGK